MAWAGATICRSYGCPFEDGRSPSSRLHALARANNHARTADVWRADFLRDSHIPGLAAAQPRSKPASRAAQSALRGMFAAARRRRFDPGRAVMGLLLAGCAWLAFWTFWGEPESLTVRTFAVESPSWRAAPLRVAFIS